MMNEFDRNANKSTTEMTSPGGKGDVKKAIDSMDTSEISDSDDEEAFDVMSAAVLSLFTTYKQLSILFLVFILYTTVGVIWFVYIEEIDFLDSLFVIMIIITTVGYGTTTAQEETYIFLIFYATAGVAIIGGVIAASAAIMGKIVVKERKDHFNYLTHEIEESETSESSEDQDCCSLFQAAWLKYKMNYILWLFCLLGGALIIGAVEHWNFLHSIYFAIISCSTIGFGDFTPETIAGKWLTIIYLPLMTTYTVYIFSALFANSISKLMAEDTAEITAFQARMENVISQKNFSRRFEQMDLNRDGMITRAEFILQCIFNEYDVSHEKLQILNSMFNTMDKDKSGEIEIKDLARVFKKKTNLKLAKRTSSAGSMKQKRRASTQTSDSEPSNTGKKELLEVKE